MFEIKYQISESIKLAIIDNEIAIFDQRYHAVRGPIELHFNGKQYGFIIDLPMMEDLLCYWFETLNKVIIALTEAKTNYIAVRIPEFAHSWIEFKKVNLTLWVRQVETFLPRNNLHMEITEPILKYESSWDEYEEIDMMQFVDEVTAKTKMFLKEIMILNSKIMESKTVGPIFEIHEKVLAVANE